MARTESFWEPGVGGTYLQTISPTGYDILINGSNKYLNFNTTVGTSGYGIRDNGGTMEFKNSGGAWTAFGSGGGTVNVDNLTVFGDGSGTPLYTKEPITILTGNVTLDHTTDHNKIFSNEGMIADVNITLDEAFIGTRYTFIQVERDYFIHLILPGSSTLRIGNYEMAVGGTLSSTGKGSIFTTEVTMTSIYQKVKMSGLWSGLLDPLI